MTSVPDLAQVRLDNALALFDEFVRSTIKHPDAATLRGLEGRFAERVHLQPSYWSQLKSRSRQIGERLARQFEQLCHKPYGWMDQVHLAGTDSAVRSVPNDSTEPQDDDERFIVGLVLSYYRRHPQRARNRLLDLLGEALLPVPAVTAATLPESTQPAAKPVASRSASKALEPAKTAATEDKTLWLRSQASVAPLRHKK
jgi:hypothetical protein